MQTRSVLLPLFVWLVILLIVLAACWPGLRGGFLFDDFANLLTLGATGPIDHWPTFWRYITSGTADPTGRPLTLLSFLLDARNWPADPYPFKRTSLILHLLNGALLAALLRQLGLTAFGRVAQRRIEMAAVLGAAFWLLHPLFVSTTLYIVQREAMLPATFTLLGLLVWLRGRRASGAAVRANRARRDLDRAGSGRLHRVGRAEQGERHPAAGAGAGDRVRAAAVDTLCGGCVSGDQRESPRDGQRESPWKKREHRD